MKKFKFLFLSIVTGLLFTGCAGTQSQIGWIPRNAVAPQNNGTNRNILQEFYANQKTSTVTPTPVAEPVPIRAKVKNPVVKPESVVTPTTTKILKQPQSNPATSQKLEVQVKRLAREVSRNKNRLANLEDRFDASSVGNVKAKLIYFKPGSAKLLSAGKKYFDTLAEKALQGKVRNIVITGHSNTVRKKGVNNLTLSEKRALSAQAYLKAKGIEALAIGKGETSRYTVNTNITVTYEEKN